MTAKERFLAVLARQIPDRLPVTTHHVMKSFLDRYLNGKNDQEFFDYFGLDPIRWVITYQFDPGKNEYFDPIEPETEFWQARRVCSDSWRFALTPIPNGSYRTERFSIITPEKTLAMVLQSNEHTTWVTERLVKERSDIDIIAKYMTCPTCDVLAIQRVAADYAERGLVRGHIICFDGYGQPGCWQDAACLYGIENLIMATYEDPEWVHTFLKILQNRKKVYLQSLKNAPYDLLELGGGDASTTVISPKLFNRFVAPYDAELIELAHQAGQRIVYHTCGGMMPILEDIAAMNPDAMETFTPVGMGGDVNLAEAKRRIGDRVCMIGGFDQFHFFTGCSEAETRQEVRRCFAAAGARGGFILSPSDHFFDADLSLIQAFADEAKKCRY